jgi:WD40 repeat protein
MEATLRQRPRTRVSRYFGLSRDVTTQLFNSTSGSKLFTMNGHWREVNFVLFTPDGSSIITGAGDALIKVWSAMNGEDVATIVGHKAEVLQGTTTLDGSTLVTASADKTVRVRVRVFFLLSL